MQIIMNMDRKTMRYAHSSGHTDVCYSEDGKKLITCGTDGDIRIWSGFDDYDPVQTCVGEWSLCVRQKNKHIQIATDNNNVQLLTYPLGERDGILTRFTAPVNHMAVGKSHDFIAVAAEDMQVKVINLSNTKEKTPHVDFSGLAGPPLSIALCPKAKFLAVSAGDGYLRLWEIENQTLLKEIDCVPKTNSFINAKILCRIDFEPNFCRYLIYPEKNTLIVLNTSNWSVKMTLTSEAIKASYSISQFSPCGNFVAAASDKGDVVVWELSSQIVVGVTNHPSSTAICAMMWNPSGNGEIAYCDVQGQLGIVTNCVYSATSDVASIPENEENDVDFGDIQFEDDEDNENAISLEKLKNDIMGTEEPELNFDKVSSAPSSRPRTPVIPLQQTFMPSSTPEHLSQRYLCWNEVGIVKSYGGANDEDNQKSIEVEFHDFTFHNSMMIQNYMGYTMGTLSTSALAIANSNQIAVLPLLTGIKEWNLKVDDEVDIVCISASQNLVCVATSNYLVHVCTIYGTQRAAFSVPGPIVTMSAHGEIIFIVYHNASTRNGDQCVSMMLVKLEEFGVRNKNVTVPLGPESTLFWIGFSDLGTPAVFDSNGMLYLFPFDSNIWLPFCDTTKHRKSPADGFFVTAVIESAQTLRGIRCKGSNYPGFTPRPTLSELPIQPPFLEIITEKSQLEANLFTWRNLKVENTDKKYKETALKIFALASKSNLDQRALELIDILADQQILTLAMKYANKLDKRRLAEKLLEMAAKLTSEEDDVSINNAAVSTPKSIMPYRKLVLPSSAKTTPTIKLCTQQVSTPVNPSGNVSRSENILNSSMLQESLTPSLLGSRLDMSQISNEDSLLSKDELKNPFLKNLKKSKTNLKNPLSLTDKFAGFDNKEKEKDKKSTTEITGKRKQPDLPSDDQNKTEKQRKLDKFMFSKRN